MHTYSAYVHFMAAILVAYGYRLFERSLFSYSSKSMTSMEIKLQNTTNFSFYVDVFPAPRKKKNNY